MDKVEELKSFEQGHLQITDVPVCFLLSLPGMTTVYAANFRCKKCGLDISAQIFIINKMKIVFNFNRNRVLGESHGGTCKIQDETAGADSGMLEKTQRKIFNGRTVYGLSEGGRAACGADDGVPGAGQADGAAGGHQDTCGRRGERAVSVCGGIKAGKPRAAGVPHVRKDDTAGMQAAGRVFGAYPGRA